MYKIISIFSCVLLMAACDVTSDNDPEKDINPNVTGTKFGLSTVSLDEAYNALKTSLDNNDQIGIVAEVDHSQNATSVGKELGTTKIIFFGNPNLGTPLMQKNQLAGLDLPQKVLFYSKEDTVFALYNSTDYLASRHALGGEPSLTQISAALENLVGGAIQNSLSSSVSQSVTANEGVETVTSSQDFEATYQSLQTIISGNENLTILAELDHQANAQSKGLELRPTKIIIFGNPNLGTPLMQASQTIGLDLPQKILVWEDADGAVHLSYNDPEFLRQRHQITGSDTEIEQITNALQNITNAAGGLN
ncbi:DUF302 domain-containing protein [Cyclobacterium qasimii]|uniref:DUF302 domain-containing protein n=2 Tax=Cyclobacterium qasimii TaxID=1350429 RepID=A0A512CAB8_9BACT|nr:DUF302 domain-containing protein [Cyclobacterium qasimii]EPR66384.1 putative inner membrane or exported protein [Cyclobacterium qasimii M12-11B]GEO21149.1 hypothetical protein CQA01_16830 [Cyclobacterium qasimii]